jgi:DNA invertase Pin-like site-specific DNA recombinase
VLIAVAVVRVSQTKGREGESFSSPQDQLDRIEALCQEHGWSLPPENVHYELGVSGDAPLEARTGLNPAVTKILTGRAQVLVGAHNERLWWSHETRAQVLRLVGDAGGEVWAADVGRISAASAAEEFSGEVRTSADRFSRKQNAEKSRAAVERAVRRGVVPFADVPPGLALDDENRVVAGAGLPTVIKAFERRERGETIKQVRAYLADNGIARSYHGVQSMLGNRLYVGEIHFGDLENLEAHGCHVDRDLFERVQRTKSPRGPRAKSERLLARLGVLRCGTCEARLTVGTQTQGGRSYVFYRCNPTGDCPRRVTIGADMVEQVVIGAARAEGRRRAVEGRASSAADAATADEEAAQAQADLDAAIRAFAGLDGESAARERLEELRLIRDEKSAHADHLRGLDTGLAVRLDRHWDQLTIDEKRAGIRATIKAVHVHPGRGVERLLVVPRGE